MHAGDWFLLRGVPYPARFAAGWPKPKNFVPGLSTAGVVEAVGAKVSGLKPGDEVYGECHGACAEYALGSEKTLVAKPASLTFEQAAAIPTSALAALHELRDAAKVQPGQRVLINGASGGVGIYAVQIAKAMGAHVTGVCSSRNVEMVRALGADDVIDYTAEDFANGDADLRPDPRQRGQSPLLRTPASARPRRSPPTQLRQSEPWQHARRADPIVLRPPAGTRCTSRCRTAKTSSH